MFCFVLCFKENACFETKLEHIKVHKAKFLHFLSISRNWFITSVKDVPTGKDRYKIDT